MIAQLRTNIVATVDGSPSQEDIGLHLHGALACGDAFALVRGNRLAAK